MRKSIALSLVYLMLVTGCHPDPDPDSSSGRQKNADFLREKLGEIVIQYSDKHSNIPEIFGYALTDSGKTLPNRGDYYGRPMIYQKLSEDSFRFVAFGRNGEFDDGMNDDVVVTYANGTFTNNAELIR